MELKKKRPLDIVVARYNEDISWTKKYQPNIIIYNKGDDHIDSSIPLPNVGRESHTYLYHIISNYNQLADRTVFVQGGQPSFGYSGTGKGGHLYSNYYFDDYIYGHGDPELIVTSAVSTDLEKLYIRKGYNKYQNIDRPISKMPLNNIQDHWLSPTSFTHFRTYLQQLKSSQKGNHNLKSFWKKYISNNYPLPPILYYNQGAQFSVSRRVIQRKGLDYYRQLIQELEHDINPYQGYYLEWLWPYILHNPLGVSPNEDYPNN